MKTGFRRIFDPLCRSIFRGDIDHDFRGQIAFIRHGTDEQPGCIVIVANGAEAEKTVDLGPDHAGAGFRDFLTHCEEELFADDQGRVTIRVNGGSVSVWVRSDAL